MTRILRPIASQKIRAKGIPMSQIVSPLVLADRNSSGQSRRRSRERSATRLDGNVTSAARTANPAIDTRHRGRLHRRDRPAASVAGGLAEVFVLRPQLLGDLAHRRDLTEHAVAHLFIDGIAERLQKSSYSAHSFSVISLTATCDRSRLRPGQRQEAALAAWGIGEDGRKSFLGLMAGSKEDVETVRAFFQDLRARGLGDPLLVVSDGAPGIIRAIEECFPRSARQRCLAHRMRNLAAKVSADPWPEFKARVTACYQAPSRAIARQLAAGLRADYANVLPSALACFEDDFEACIAHLRLPVTHRRFARTTNLLERLFVEERRRLKIIPNGFGEKPVLLRR